MWRIFILLPVALFAVRAGPPYSSKALLYSEDGIELKGWYFLQLLGNPVGGIEQGFANASSLYASLKVERQDWDFLISGMYDSGRNLSDTIGCNVTVASAFGNTTAFLFELYVRRRFCWGEVQVGRICPALDFITTDVLWWYVSGAFDAQPEAIFANVPSFFTWPIAAWGATAFVDLTQTTKAKFGVYNGNLDVLQNRYHGLNFTFSSPSGYLILSELEWKTDVSHLHIGGYYLTGEEQSIGGELGRGNWGTYGILAHQIYKRGAFRLTPWAMALISPKKQNTFPFSWYSGLVAQGWMKGRPRDATVFGLAIAKFRPKEQTYEMTLELNQWFWLNEWVAITADMQYVINPNGVGTIPNALVLGVQLSATF